MNITLFLTLPAGRIEAYGFWFVWGCTFVLHAVVWLAAILYLGYKPKDDDLRLPIIFTVLIGGFATYVCVASVFFFYAINFNLKLAIIVESCMTAAFFIAILIALFAMGCIRRNQSTVEDKVLFIRLLYADINTCVACISDPTLQKRLQNLAERVRLSDPISHKTLRDCEEEIALLVADLRKAVMVGEMNDVDPKIKKIQALLDYRNERCKILK